ncbi:HYR domain-containing protein [Algibacter mikhailovii]|uniref:HYR domain-containing protein n=1 Tax=Algibacter mikhailovii TaxID=425498 RepID=A0A918R931_9FLAO|nr:HYR domain-containing protein [Algibacter mikhailovii]GGZ88109.1 hypothetical protein GCM10007028_28040 [Algibacter mikhailovii]
MLENKANFLVILSICTLFIHCSSHDEPNDIKESIDITPPTIQCISNIESSVDTFTNEAIITYATPIGTDNNEGSITTQTAGIASGEKFPIGTTTNIFLVTDAAGNSAECSFDVIVTKKAPSTNMPYFVSVNPTPAEKKWAKVENLSDEFNSNIFDEVKWKNTNPTQWIGRAPGLFKKNTVSQADGALRLTADILHTPEVVNGMTFTHAGSNITSNASAKVGQYFECRMKANKTFMSSTFWLINVKNEGSNCDKRTTELDIQECVGQITGTDSWTKDKDRKMNSNTHSRNTSCVETPTGSAGNDMLLDTKASEDYHIYAAWWKSSTEIEFYLDGTKAYTVTPPAHFNLDMYIRLVVETYNWNPVPADGGMTGSVEDRTTYYDWVRTWKLEDL